MSGIVVVTGLPAAGKSFLSKRFVREGGQAIDCSALAATLLENPLVWTRQRAALQTILGVPHGDFWPCRGLDSLEVAWSPAQAAAFERRLGYELTAVVVAAARYECVVVEATPGIARVLLSCLPVTGILVVVKPAESVRVQRLAERFRGRISDRLVEQVASFHRAMYQSDLFALRHDEPGWVSCTVSN